MCQLCKLITSFCHIYQKPNQVVCLKHKENIHFDLHVVQFVLCSGLNYNKASRECDAETIWEAPVMGLSPKQEKGHLI